MIQLLPYLLFLLCPVSMGAMMWMMMRGMGRAQPPDPRIAELESQVADLRSSRRETRAEAAEPQR